MPRESRRNVAESCIPSKHSMQEPGKAFMLLLLSIAYGGTMHCTSNSRMHRMNGAKCRLRAQRSMHSTSIARRAEHAQHSLCSMSHARRAEHAQHSMHSKSNARRAEQSMHSMSNARRAEHHTAQHAQQEGCQQNRAGDIVVPCKALQGVVACMGVTLV